MSQFSLDTPWGRADQYENLGGGILSVQTASHGGLFVPDEMLHCIPQNHQDWAAQWSRSTQWYEEDVCWSAVAVAFPDRFTERELESARQTINLYFPQEAREARA